MRLRVIALLLVALIVAHAQSYLPHRRSAFRKDGGAAAPTYIYEENFEGAGAPAGWTTLGGTPDYDFTTSPGEGSHSVQLLGDEASYSGTLFDQAEIWFYLLLRIENLVDQTDVLYIADNNPDPVLILRVGPTMKLIVNPGAAPAETTDAIPEDTWIHVWLRYEKGTGANAEGEVWWSTDGTKPSDVSTKHALSTTGNETVNARRVWINSDYTAPSNADYRYDKFRADDVAIGSNPP